MTRLERRRWFQRYFWEIDRAGSTLAIRTGKRGELGELTHEQCADERAARERRELLVRAQLSAGWTLVEGEVTDEESRTLLTNELLERGGGRIAIVMHLDLPPQVIVPFAFSAYKDAGAGIRLERCAARSVEEQALIAEALSRAGVEASERPCKVGLGGPRGDWTQAIEASLNAL